MTSDQLMAFGLMAVTVAAFIWGKLRYDLVALTALIVGALTGVVPVKDMFNGFSNDLIWIIASALLLSAAIARSGVIERVLEPLLGVMKTVRLQIPGFAGITLLLSMMMKNIGALALLMPVALQHARKTGTSPSRLLMPMSFASLLGGLVTLVGTSPNIIVSSVRESLLGKPYQLFDFAPVGLGVCLAGFAFLAVAPFFIRIDRAAPTAIDAALEAATYVTELAIPEESDWIGKPLTELVALCHDGCRIISIVTPIGKLGPKTEHAIVAGDRLLVEGEQADLEKFAKAAKLALEGERHRAADKASDEVKVVEGVISADSVLVGRTVAQSRLHERYGLSLLAVSREGARISNELRAVRLRAGDVMILKAGQEFIGEALADLRILPLSERSLSLGAKRFGYAPIFLLAAAIVSIAMGWAPIQLAFPAAAVGVLLLRVMTMQEAYRSIDGSLLVLLAALIPLSESISRTGGDVLIAHGLSFLLQPLPMPLAVAALIVVGMAVTPFLNNAATVLIVAPIAAAAAHDLGVKPDPYLMAVAMGAACDFLTPIGHQCNTLVMGPGGYKFADYWRLGLPLSIIVVVVATPLIMMVWA
ncbi:MAG: SLC13 family permease [Alphaproteobacteria bacterium]